RSASIGSLNSSNHIDPPTTDLCTPSLHDALPISAEEVRAEGTAEDLVSARTFPGNRPTTSIIAPELSPAVLGQLIALYEHITFVQGAVWGINSFDQWGVELGKQLALDIAPALGGDEEALAAQDASTRAAIEHYLAARGPHAGSE